ncbi:hypothetical protein CM15mP5_0040 [bacterium]|nr:MAG: hypothetical protein CM15mP5_0040 [bacterium]
MKGYLYLLEINNLAKLNNSDLVNYIMEISEIKDAFIAANQKYDSLRGYL